MGSVWEPIAGTIAAKGQKGRDVAAPVNLGTGTSAPWISLVVSMRGRFTRSNLQMNRSTLGSSPIR
jgi:hypothetical protein